MKHTQHYIQNNNTYPLTKKNPKKNAKNKQSPTQNIPKYGCFPVPESETQQIPKSGTCNLQNQADKK